MLTKYFLILFVLCAVVYATVLKSRPCILKKFQRGLVCVCNSTYCDSLGDFIPKYGQFVAVSSSDDGLRFDLFRGEISRPLKIPRCLHKGCDLPDETNSILGTPVGFINVSLPTKEKVLIDIDPTVKFEKIHGFGGAYTGAVSYVVSKMSKGTRRNFYKAYYSRTCGIGYKFMRLSIGGSDFEKEMWAYNEWPRDDINLSNFTEIHPSDMDKVGQIKELMCVTRNHKIKMIATAWSPPRWMKTNNEWSGFGFLKEEYYQTWADYQLKYLRLMDQNGLRLWGLGTANEMVASLWAPIPSLRWIPSNYAAWLGNNLFPTIRSSEFNATKVFIFEDQRYVLPHFIDFMEMANDKFMKETDGIALHWYTDKRSFLNSVDDLRKKYPGKLLYMTESSICSVEDKHLLAGPRLGDWKRALTYMDLIMENFEHSLEAWIDWNLIVDETGGPKTNINFCDAAMIVNMTTYNEFYKQPIYYVFGHFSKFIIDGTVRIGLRVSNSAVEAIGFLRPDNLVVVVINNPFFVTSPVEVVIRTGKQQKIHMEIPSYSMHTVLYWIGES